MPFERELDQALRWMDDADAIALRHFRVDVPYERKGDGTPVTAADREVEQAVRARIEQTFSGDAVLGEEQGATGDAGRRWILDPIDGTKNFMRGVPIFGTLLALEADGDTVLGVVSAPALRMRWWAVRGSGAFRDGEQIRVSQVSLLEDAHLVTGGLTYCSAEDWSRMQALVGAVARERGYGDFLGHMLVAQGSQDAMVDFAPLAPWDVAAPKVIVEEAGGRWTDLLGRDTQEGACIASNGLLHEQVVGALAR